MHYKKNKKYFKAFTLVELIIVITILAILATIAFVSFSNYTVGSRDTKRVVTIENISKGLNIFQTQTGKYPNIDNQTSTGIINSDALSFVGEVGDRVSKLININPTPKDPVSGNNFKYATSFDNKYFQVAGTQEKPIAKTSIINQSYANTRQAKVLGNYNGLLKKENKLYNLPSLIYTGSGNLLSNTTYFVIDKGQNIPYKIASSDIDNSVQTSVILNQLTGTSSVTLTGVTLPSTLGELKTNMLSFVQVLGYQSDKIGQETFGTQYLLTSGTEGLSTNASSGPYISCLAQNNPLPFAATTTYLGCNEPDIIVCSGYQTGYTIASCNVGSSIAGIDYGSYGRYFQWGENVAWNATSSPGSANNCTGNRDTQICGVSAVGSWQTTVSDTGSLGIDRWNDYGDVRGPCALGYKVPSKIDWGNIHIAGNWLNNGTNMQNALKLPYAGYRYRTDGLLSETGLHAYFWTSTPDNTNSWFFKFSSNSIYPNDHFPRQNAFSVRCVKN